MNNEILKLKLFYTPARYKSHIKNKAIPTVHVCSLFCILLDQHNEHRNGLKKLKVHIIRYVRTYVHSTVK